MENALIGWGGEKRKPLQIEGKMFPELGMTPNVKVPPMIPYLLLLHQPGKALFPCRFWQKHCRRKFVFLASPSMMEPETQNIIWRNSWPKLGLRRGRLRESLAEKPPRTLDELLKRAAKYIRIEEALKPKVDSSNKRKIHEGERKDPRREGLAEGQRHMPPDGFHKDRGHNTKDCYHLKNEIEKLIQRGYLKEYVENNPSGNNAAPRMGGKEFEEAESSRRKEKGRENLPAVRVTGVVIGGPAGGD
ncbi:UNVERIFIED_CONTAM: hypothetical protein Sradi_5233100 [Sesamum radiatum]|uniref:Reverse transcriptase domain-containing protein n=1 Tax=Sesamum radiatum TaxID=300843 RepID=A0AAW2LNF8_SESRA